MTIKNQQTDEMRRAGQAVKMLCGTTQSGTGGHPNIHNTLYVAAEVLQNNHNV